MSSGGRGSSAARAISPGRFAGQVVVVTGAAQGIGRAVASRVTAEGAHTVLVDRADLVHEAAAELSADGGSAFAVTADLEDYAGASAAIEAALNRHGRIDVLINNVGGTIWAKPFEHYEPEQISKEIQRSLFPTLWACRAVLPHMISQAGGVIVNVASVATRGINRVPYAAAKGGVKAITAALALEAAPHGIRVVATAPGGTEAPARRVARGPQPEGATEKAWYQQIVDQTIGSSLMKRYGTLEEQAGPIAFLASAEASYITGSVLAVAGGDLG
ncbi:1,6-dihydroxycyclohexa-2,4-diene-1-carboxylate dehydrogenase [Arthrobacter sp. NicSoilB8]|uniref:1,6-dihydroxycyclohexa-2,4-diene-1-carboxylate dehydrogenase n=1 Tax=Arthrobacter sp. NicSoilB8 TaxID=2830998 RepID=UPI001CC33AF2|nr:1,6-dihydroxycyclohexa-2,4-diene-1-carboxylate dehydrogenase [Arthrobacter sp. NicSoilB8]BCW71998.1 1,6-dihydroxycyclohexa-2,4-diene-1-carboxylate dehydrogenase [Arthrobacter sp. NicSoilB8]